MSYFVFCVLSLSTRCLGLKGQVIPMLRPNLIRIHPSLDWDSPLNLEFIPIWISTVITIIKSGVG